MLQRTCKKQADFTLTKEPGNVARALDISTIHPGSSLSSENIYIAEDNTENKFCNSSFACTAKIEIESAGEDSLLPYRFFIKGNKYVSGKRML